MNCGFEMWDWQGQDYVVEDNTGIEIINEIDRNDGGSYMFDDETTPVKACGDLAYRVTNNVMTGKDLEEQYREPSSQVKRRRMLQFESEILETPLCNDEAFLRSKETPDSLEDALSEMSQWVSGFSEDTSGSSNECMDPSAEGWIVDCFNDSDMHFCTEDFRSASGASDVQNEVIDLCNSPPPHDANLFKKHPVTTHQNVVFKGQKSYMRTPPKLASSVVYPFAFIKPCGIQGQVTLKDINQRIHNPPKPKPKEDPDISYPTSAFSGKPVVGKTKIRTEGGKGCITIMRTKG